MGYFLQRISVVQADALFISVLIESRQMAWSLILTGDDQLTSDRTNYHQEPACLPALPPAYQSHFISGY